MQLQGALKSSSTSSGTHGVILGGNGKATVSPWHRFNYRGATIMSTGEAVANVSV